MQILGFLHKNPSTTGKSTRSPSIRASLAALAPTPVSRLEELPPPLHRAACRAPRGHPRHGRRPGRGKEGAPNRAVTELDEGAATALAGHRGRQFWLPPPRAEVQATGSS